MLSFFRGTKEEVLMKKMLFGVVLIFGLTSCSFNDVISLVMTPTSAPVDMAIPEITDTPQGTPTITPTQSTPTYTITPTLLGDRPRPTTDINDASIPTLTPLPTLTRVPQTNFFGSVSTMIQSLSVSNDVLLWGYCEGIHYVDFDVSIASTIRFTYVLLYMRLVDKGGNQSTKWGGGAIMRKVSGGRYTYRVRPENISYYEEFKDAWVEYQVIVANSSLASLDRSPVYKTSLSLEYCRPVQYELTP